MFSGQIYLQRLIFKFIKRTKSINAKRRFDLLAYKFYFVECVRTFYFKFYGEEFDINLYKG